MRTLSATLTTAQKSIGVDGGVTPDPIWKIILSRSGQTTRGYDRERIRQIRETEEDDSQILEVLLDNSDQALIALNFERFQGIFSSGYNTAVARTAWAANTAYAVDDIRVPTTANANGYQYRCSVAGTSHATTEPTWGTALGVTQTDGTVTWEMDGNTGDEYSPCPQFKVESQEFFSGMGTLLCQLYLIGKPNQMAQDKAESRYTQESTDTSTVKTLITAIAQKTLAPYTNYTSVTATYDSEDSIIDSFKPADFFSVEINENRLEKIKELLAYTGCKMRFRDDGQMHVLDPVTTGTTYDYEYKFDVSGDHTFFSKAIRERFVNPNKDIVKTPQYATTYSGSATSATSYALDPKTRTTLRRLASTAQATAIAGAMIEHTELASERGSITVPMNVGQEVWDYVKVTDSRQNDTRTGNVQRIQRRIKIPEGREPLTWEMEIRFGRVSELSLLSQIAAGGNLEAPSQDRYALLAANIGELANYLIALAGTYDQLRQAHNGLLTFVKEGLARFLYAVTNGVALLGDASVFIGTTYAGGINIKAGSINATPITDTLQLEAVDDVLVNATDDLSMKGDEVYISSGGNTATPAEDDLIIDAGDDLWLYADTDVIIKPAYVTSTGRTKVDKLDTTPTDITASRSFDTTYTNSGLKPLLVVVTVAIDLAEEVALKIHATADPPTTQVAYLLHSIATGTIYASLSAIVPVGWKYRVVSLTGTPTKSIWIEYDLG